MHTSCIGNARTIFSDAFINFGRKQTANKMLKTSIKREKKTSWRTLGCVQPELPLAFQITESIKGHTCWQQGRRTSCIKWTKKNKPSLQGFLRITSSVVVKDAGTISTVQKELKTTLFRKARASKPAV